MEDQSTNTSNAEGLKATSDILEIPLKVQAAEDGFLFIVYDIPVSEAGNKARASFLEKARRVGAVQHTESVYYMPWTDYADRIALELAMDGQGTVFALYSRAVDKSQSESLRHTYDMRVLKWIDELQARLTRIDQHTADGKFGLAFRMLESSIRLNAEMTEIVNRRGGEVLPAALRSLVKATGELLDRTLLAEKLEG
jgi:hypothetical protein